MHALILKNMRPILGMALVVWGTTAAAETCSIRGVVSQGSGQPAASVWIVASQGQGGPELARSLSTDNGRYYLAPLQPGFYSITARRGERTLVVQSQVRCVGEAVHDIRIP